eukprot:scaffold192852_cov19-Tisochrysis_lutea.AAC.1
MGLRSPHLSAAMIRYVSHLQPRPAPLPLLLCYLLDAGKHRPDPPAHQLSSQEPRAQGQYGVLGRAAVAAGVRAGLACDCTDHTHGKHARILVCMHLSSVCFDFGAHAKGGGELVCQRSVLCTVLPRQVWVRSQPTMSRVSCAPQRPMMVGTAYELIGSVGRGGKECFLQ